MKERIDLSYDFPVPPKKLYEAWLDSDTHAEFTGAAAIFDAKVKGRYTTWDEYIEGVILELVPNKKIVMTWRTDDFSDFDEDSKVELTFEKIKTGTRLHLKHTNIPKLQSKRYKEGWIDFYFNPMKEYFWEE
jgi:uncharacterized protein YndB with AHSA1/START domain